MALTGDAKYIRRGAALNRNEFGYPVAPGEQVYVNSMVGLNAAGQLQRIQTAGTIVFLGLANQNVNNVGLTAAGPTVVGLKGSWKMVVPTAAFSNIGATVYASDDSTLSLVNTGGTLLVAGTLAGIEGGNTYVNLAGS
jgi:hypothetical protein